jgi:eukaryotic-like serine/threonine-protein kinase
VLDFGLAKIAASADASAEATRTIGVTEGMVIGTAAYMSPEQARGQVVDRRSDIWAFGCVLYEMLTGERLFAGEGTTDTLALVFTKEPDWSALPPEVPPAVRALLKRCLERDRLKRIGDVAAIRFALEDVSGLSATDQPAAGSTPSVAPAAERQEVGSRRSSSRPLVLDSAPGISHGSRHRERRYPPVSPI